MQTNSPSFYEKETMFDSAYPCGRMSDQNWDGSDTENEQFCRCDCGPGGVAVCTGCEFLPGS